MAQKTYDDLTIILPTYHEGGNIQSMLETLDSLYPGASIIVADDNSKDETLRWSVPSPPRTPGQAPQPRPRRPRANRQHNGGYRGDLDQVLRGHGR